MWQATHSMVVPDIDRNQVWAAWENVNEWHHWDEDIEYARLDGSFAEGATFTLRPRGGPNVRIRLLRAEPLVGYTDLASFPLAKMYGIHDMYETPDGLTLTITIRVEGPLGWLWRKLVAQKVADEAPAQMEALANFVRSPRRAVSLS